MATAALEAGKHVFVEKPLGFGVAETEAIAAVARKSQGKLMVGYHKRFDPHYLRARDEVRSMKDLRYAEVTVLHPEDAAYRTHHVVLPLPEKPWAPPPEAETYRGLFRDAAEGPLAEGLTATLGSQAPAPLAHRVGALLLFLSLIHDVDAVRGILGEPEEVVSAAVWREGLAQHSLTRFPKDVRVSMSWISLPGLKHYEERLRFCSPEKRVTLTFPSPYLRHLPTPLEIETTDGEAWVVERPVLTYEEAFRAELHHFRDCVVSGRQPSTGVDDALGDARWIEKIARAYARA
jgi:predicted dehydrogenase